MYLEKYVKNKQYYIDLYDKFTIEECRIIEQNKTEIDKKDRKNSPWQSMIYDLRLYFVKGERYLEKQKTIEKWIQEDKAKEERFNNTELYLDIDCLNCKSPMELEHKHFHGLDDAHILFIYRCKKCGKGRGFLEDGTEYIPETPKCARCQKELKTEVQKKTKGITFIDSCNHCNYKNKWTIKNEREKVKIDPYFAEDRRKFCLSEEEGKEYLDSRYQLESIGDLIADFNEKEENKEFYDQLANLEKLTVIQMQGLLAKKVKKYDFTDLTFAKPKIDRYVIVDFTIQDNKSNRSEYDSEMDLKKVINKALHNTNWRLMTNGPYYRLGILSGQLKGLENEKDLLDKIKYRKPLPK